MPNASWSWMIQVKATTRRILQPEKEQNPFSRRKRSLSLRRLSYLRAASQSLSSALTCPLKMLEEFFSFWSSVRNLERCLLCTLFFSLTLEVFAICSSLMHMTFWIGSWHERRGTSTCCEWDCIREKQKEPWAFYAHPNDNPIIDSYIGRHRRQVRIVFLESTIFSLIYNWLILFLW